ncbi:hypothetical protein [Calothrix sp. PCC 7507]|uniref:hypothetical protein n=1 Tax=Calothrix sp. PCC 7507 TaxID=99598 RepID=UPI00029EED98|nr:hypothetical protein [Calothrix sp. PCC 7507]AFY33141.1 hypothetical protein Cal7507_2720 [Calothrix sp. PCC 7507]
MNHTSPPPSNWELWQQWVVACGTARVIGVFIDWITLLLSFIAIKGANADHIVFFFVLLFNAISAALGGIAQWFVLRWWINSAKYWVLASSLASPLGVTVNNTIKWLDIATVKQDQGNSIDFLKIFIGSPGRISPVIFDTFYGAILGFAQWLILKGKVPQAGWWVLASSFATLISGVVVRVTRQTLGRMGWYFGDTYDPLNIAIAAFGGVVYGAIAGIVLVRLLQKSRELNQ